MRSQKPTLLRRHVLKGAGVALSLPFIESLLPKTARGQEMPAKRFVSIYTPHGAPSSWEDTTGAGPAWQLSKIQASLAAVQSKMLMVRRLANFTWRSDLLNIGSATGGGSALPGGVKWDDVFTRDAEWCDGCVVPVGAYLTLSHARAAGAYANCLDGDDWRTKRGEDESASPRNPQTVDQLIAGAIGTATARPSLQLGLLNGNGALDFHHANLCREMSYDDKGNPLNKRVDPRAVFDDIVGAAAPVDPIAGERRRALDISALDAVQQSAETLSPRLATADRERLDQFLTSTRELELRIGAVAQGGSCRQLARPEGGLLLPGEVGFSGNGPQEITADTVWQRATAMNDLLVMALECDVTRVITYQLDNSRSDLVYSWLRLENGGQVNAFHDETHLRWDPKPASPPGFEAISTWMSQVVADLVQKLDGVPEGAGTLLDNSVVMYGSDQHNADHAAWDLPIVLFGGGSGTFKRGELLALPTEVSQMRQLRDFYFTLLNEYFQLNAASFGEDRRGVPNALLTEVLA
ncbi:MAG: hypothetical protein RJA70_1273 [Pseudomonadota bacterium]